MARGMPSGGSGNSFSPNLADVKELWNTWEIHVLILVSLFLQVFLFFFAGMRRRSSSTILRVVLWLAYLSADSVAIFVLGNLAVHAEGSRHHLMYFWAPFVLVHLGGQDTITAFSKQDNELWRRHLLNLVTQVAVAGYVVAKASWPDSRLRAAMVIMFLVGCFKYAERTLCLFLSRPLGLYSKSLRSLNWIVAERRTSNRPDRHRSIMTEILKNMLKGSGSVPGDFINIMSVDAPFSEPWTITIADEISGMLAEFKSHPGRCAAYKCVEASLEECYLELHTKGELRKLHFELFSDLFSELKAFPSFEAFLGLLLLVALFVLPPIFQYASATIALVLFMAAEKGDRLCTSKADITVTYILLVGAIALDVCSFFSNLRYIPEDIQLKRRTVFRVVNCIRPAVCRKQWAEELAQYNMIETSTPETEWPTSYKSLAACLFGSTTTHVPINKSRTPIKKIILDNLLSWGKKREWNITSSRGTLSLQKWMCKHQDPDSARTGKALEKSISFDFPISVLIWHIATDMCYYRGDNSTAGTDQTDKDNKQVSRELSNYIMYLVFKCGVKRTVSTQVVHDRANAEIRFFLRRAKKTSERDAAMDLFEADKAQQQDSNDEIQKAEEQQDSSVIEVPKLGDEQDSTVPEIQNPDEEQQDSSMVTESRKPRELDSTQDSGVAEIQKQKESDHGQDSMAAGSQKHAEGGDSNLQKLLQSTLEALDSSVLPQASELARELLGIEDAAERWRLIAGVWSEMLFYVALRCGGAFHYEHLTTGGEFVTHVLVLMKLLGPFLPPTSA